MLSKIAASGLDQDDAKKLGLKAYPSDHELPLSIKAAGFSIPYFEPNGKPNCFSRFRLLETPPASNGFASVAAKPPKYLQAPKTEPGVYIPPYVDWKALLADPAVPLIVTEGELKAACASKRGFPTLGLGGVWSFRSKQHLFLPLLEKTTWAKRVVYVIYDSDAVANPQVLKAENTFSREILQRGAEPYIVRLKPLESGQKCGLDDYLVAHSDDDLTELMMSASSWGPSHLLHEFNEEVLYVRDPGLVIRMATMPRIAPAA